MSFYSYNLTTNQAMVGISRHSNGETLHVASCHTSISQIDFSAEGATSQHYSESSVFMQSATGLKQVSRKLALAIAQKPAPLGELDINALVLFLKSNSSMLFTTSDSGKTLFSLLTANCPRNNLILWIANLLENEEPISKAQFQEIKEFLLNSNPLYENTPFQSLMRKENCNKLFDRFISLIDNDDLNAHQDWKRQVLCFAFSDKRYQELFLKDDEVEEDLCSQFESLGISQIDHSSNYPQWLSERRKSSGTLTTPTKEREKCIANWDKANAFILQLAKNKSPLCMDTIITLHKLLTEGEQDVDHPGITRDQLDCVVKLSGSWRNLPCPPEKLTWHIRRFDHWMKEQFDLCDQGKKDPILFAGQAYQRFVSLHPFENGNGRTGRSVMDYILERYGLPPPVLGDDLFVIVYPLDPASKKSNVFIHKLVMGIKTSYSMLNA